jgi:hypothetical protein
LQRLAEIAHQLPRIEASFQLLDFTEESTQSTIHDAPAIQKAELEGHCVHIAVHLVHQLLLHFETGLTDFEYWFAVAGEGTAFVLS